MTSRKEIVIVGGGAIGCSIAYHLAKKGVPSRIVEMDSIASQASGRAWAVISALPRLLLFYEGVSVPKGFMQPCLSLFEEGFQRFPKLSRELKEEGGIDIEWGDLPCLYLVSEESEERDLKQRMAELYRNGSSAEWLDAGEVEKRLPGISVQIRGGVYYPGQQVEPYRYVLSMFQAAEKLGVEITQIKATGFRTDKGKVKSVILADGSEIAGDIFVIATGPWSAEHLGWLGKTMPIEVRRTQCIRVEVPRKFPAYRILCGKAAIIPKVNGSVILGIAGKYEEHEVTHDFNDTPTEKLKSAILVANTNLFPELEEAKLVEHRAGLENWQPKGGLPVMGPVPDWANVYLAAWLGAWGIQNSPAVGRVMAEAILTGRMPTFLEPLSPAHFVSNNGGKKQDAAR